MLLNFDFLQNLSSFFWIKAAICLIFSFFFCSKSIQVFLNYIKNNPKFYQPIRESGPETHLQSKNKTPTFGGFFIILSTLITAILFLDHKNCYFWVFLWIFLTFGAIGFIDDFLKVFKRNTCGFKGSVKLIIQFLIIGIAYIWLGQINEFHHTHRVFFPVLDHYSIYIGATLYVIFFAFAIVGASNAVNITDGLDGLVSVPAIVNLICLIILITISSSPEYSRNLHLPHVKNSQELIFFCFALIGSIAGFLRFNLKPAKIFMGDVGSLAIGATLGLIAVIIKQEFIFFIISLLFVIEISSVILQVASYKTRKKRIFLMAPIHHHFEKLGWRETKVVKFFWSLSLLFAIIGISITIF